VTDAAVADRRLHPGTMALRILKGLPQTLLLFPAILTAASNVRWYYFLPIAAASLAVSALAGWIAWRRFLYGVAPGELVIERGLIQRSRRTIPFERIQDVDFEQGPLHRLFGLVRLRFETGGEGGDEGTLDSVTVAEAERLRAAIRAGRTRAVSDAPATDAAEGTSLFAMDIGRVMLFGLFNFSMLWLAGIFAMLQTVSSWLPFDLYDVGAWLGLAERNLGGRVTIGAISGVVLLAIALGLASGVVSTLARDFGFRLTLEPAGFRRRRGLLTRSEMLIPRARIQLGLIQSGPLRRLLGWQRLRFQTLGMGKAAADGGLQDAAPFARAAEIDAVLAVTGRLRRPDAAQLVRVSRRHVWKAVILAALLPMAAVTVATIFMPVLILTALAVPPLVIFAIVERRCHLYAHDGALLFVQTGYWRRRIWIVPVDAIQAVTMRRSWLQRLLDLATLELDTAGASYGGPAIRDIDAGLAEQLADAMTERNRNGWV
jgi:putative membrane protein